MDNDPEKGKDVIVIRKAEVPWSAPTSVARLKRHVLWLAGLARRVPQRADQ